MESILEHVFEAPVRSPAIPCGSGEYALYTQSTHSLSEHKTTQKIFRVEVATGETAEVDAQKQDANFEWIEPTKNLIWQRRNDNANDLWVEEDGNRYCIGSTAIHMVLFQAVMLDNNDLGILLYSKDIVSDSTAPHSSGKMFENLPSLTFDQGIGRTESKLFFARATRSAFSHEKGKAKYTLCRSGAMDVLGDSNLKWFPHSGAMPNMSLPNCGISRSGIAFSATKGGKTQLLSFTSEPYFMSISNSSVRLGLVANPTIIPTLNCDGWTGPPRFSPDGESLAFWREELSEKPFSHRSIFVVRNLNDGIQSENLHLVDKGGQTSSLYPETIRWANDKSSLYLTGIEHGRQKLFRVDAKASVSNPIQLAPLSGARGSVIAVHMVTEKDICVLTSSSFNSFSSFSVLNLADNTRTLIPGQADPKFSNAEVSEAWFESEGRQIRTHILRPSGFDRTKKYPLALFVHGGPFSTWADAYMSRWSMAVFAEQGYIVLTPDFTGSVGHSRDFRDAVWGEMGGKPYRDLEACMDYAERELPYIDIHRSVCLGASYGGYMVLWIAGQPLAKRFKALVSHATAMFGAASVYATDVPGLWQKLAGGEIDDSGDMAGILDRWDPSRYAKNWTIPILLTHGARDNRCSVSASLAAFTHCQAKGLESKLLVFPDESHFILKPENAYHWYKEVIAWMNRFTKT